MDRLNLRQLCIISFALALSACASTPHQQDESSTSSSSSEPVATSQEEVVAENVEASKVESSVNEPVAETSVSEAPAVEPVIESVAAPADTNVPVISQKAEDEASKAAVKMPTDPNSFLIQAGTKDEKHPFYGMGDKRGFLVNGVPGKTLVLTRGEIYKFIVATGVQHDFYFSTSDRGWGAGTITDGIEGQFTYEGTVKVTPNATTPSVMYYQCRNHKNMGGKIHVINKGEKVKLDAGGTAGDAQETKPSFQVTEQQVKQKLSYAKMLISSDSSKRILESGNAEAKDLNVKAKDYLTKADSALAAKKNEEAMAAVDEALRLINASNRLAPTVSTTASDDVDYKAQYDAMLVEIEGYKKSYTKNIEKNGHKANAKLDEKKFNNLMAEAAKLAGANNHKAALKPMQDASSMMTDVISVMLHDSVVVYDKDFSTPQEEYEYELSHYESYLELVPLAKEQHQPDERQLQLMEQFVEKAKSIASEGAAIAKKGDYKLAVQAYQAATDNLKRALMLVGVR